MSLNQRAAGAQTSSAAPAIRSTAAALPLGPAAPLAVNNLGLTTDQAIQVQKLLNYYHYGHNGAYDGLLGTQSWEAMQNFLRQWGYPGNIDGIDGTGTITNNIVFH